MKSKNNSIFAFFFNGGGIGGNYSGRNLNHCKRRMGLPCKADRVYNSTRRVEMDTIFSSIQKEFTLVDVPEHFVSQVLAKKDSYQIHHEPVKIQID